MSTSGKLFQESLKLFPGSAGPSLDLTIGCEFEFLMVSLVEEGDDESMFRQDCIRVVLEALQNPLRFTCESCNQEGYLVLPIKEIDRSLSHWEIDFDITVESREEEVKALGLFSEDYWFCGLELKTRILGQAACHTKKCCGQGVLVSEEITAVLDRLNNDFGRLDNTSGPAKQLIFCNPSCGFHVHMSKLIKSFPQSTIQKILSLMVACEQQFDNIHSVDRITGYMLQDEGGLRYPPFPARQVIDRHVYNIPLSMFYIADADRKRRRDRGKHGQDFVRKGFEVSESQLSTQKLVQKLPDDNFDIWLARRLPEIDSWILRIRSAECLNDVVHLNKEGRRNGHICTFNMANLKMSAGEVFNTDTIEFRQHRGTLHVPAVTHYINFLVRLVVFCHETSDEEFYPLLEPHGSFRARKFNVHDLCKAIRCRRVTRDYFRNYLDSDSRMFLDLRKEEEEYAKNLPPHPLADLCRHVIKEAHSLTDPRSIEQRIFEKLVHGGYGHFRAEYLGASSSPTLDSKIELAKRLEQMRLSYVAPLNDRLPDDLGTDPKGANAIGYGIIHSEDSDPQFDVRESDLLERIKHVLVSKENGTYNTLSLKESQKRINRDSSSSLSASETRARKSPRALRLKAKGSGSNAGYDSTASLSAEDEIRQPVLKRKIHRSDYQVLGGVGDGETSESWSASSAKSQHPKSSSSRHKGKG